MNRALLFFAQLLCPENSQIKHVKIAFVAGHKQTVVRIPTQRRGLFKIKVHLRQFHIVIRQTMPEILPIAV